MRQIIVIAHNLRSSHNVGSLLRTAEGLGVTKVYLTGYTPYPIAENDPRLPHLARKINRQISKTALGAENSLPWEHHENITVIIDTLRDGGWKIAAVEQSDMSIKLPDFIPVEKIVIIVGREVEGIEPEILKLMDVTVEIPMFGSKESFNVVQAAAMALYHMRFA